MNETSVKILISLQNLSASCDYLEFHIVAQSVLNLAVTWNHQ